MPKSKLFRLWFTLSCIVSIGPMALHAQKYDVKTTFKHGYFDHEPKHLFTVDVQPQSFNLWLAEQVERKKLAVYTDEELKSPLPMDAFYELFFPQLFTERYHWNRTAMDNSDQSLDRGKLVPEADYWKGKIAESHSIKKALRMTADQPSTLLWQTHDQSVFFLESWQINGQQVEINPQKILGIHFSSLLDNQDTIGEVFLRIDPTQLPAELFRISNNFTILNHASNQQVFDLGLYGLSIESYRAAGEEGWPSIGYIDPFKEVLMSHLEAKWDAALPQLKWNTQTIPRAKFSCLTSANDHRSEYFYLQGYSFQDTSEFSTHREFAAEIVWPLLLEVLQGKRKAYSPEMFSKSNLPLRPGTDYIRLHQAIQGEWYSEDDEDEFQTSLNKYAYLDTLSPASAVPDEFQCYLKLFNVWGSWNKKGNRVSFQPEYLLVIWDDLSETLPARDFCLIPLKETKLTFKGQLVTKYLASLKYPHILIGSNQYAVLVKYEGIWLEKMIQSAKWDKIPDFAALNLARKMDDQQWLEFLKALE